MTLGFASSIILCRSHWARLLLLAAMVATSGCASKTLRAEPGEPAEGREIGMASYYNDKYHGRQTASGARHDQQALTAAHRTLPFGTRVRVRHLENGREVVVRIIDRGPFVKGRIIDLSRRAAEQIDMVQAGIARVEVTPAAP